MKNQFSPFFILVFLILSSQNFAIAQVRSFEELYDASSTTWEDVLRMAKVAKIGGFAVIVW